MSYRAWYIGMLCGALAAVAGIELAAWLKPSYNVTKQSQGVDPYANCVRLQIRRGNDAILCAGDEI